MLLWLKIRTRVWVPMCEHIGELACKHAIIIDHAFLTQLYIIFCYLCSSSARVYFMSARSRDICQHLLSLERCLEKESAKYRTASTLRLCGIHQEIQKRAWVPMCYTAGHRLGRKRIPYPGQTYTILNRYSSRSLIRLMSITIGTVLSVWYGRSCFSLNVFLSLKSSVAAMGFSSS